MKIKQDDLEVLRKAIAPLDTPVRREAYRNRQFPRADRCKNVDMRYRWDLLYMSGLKIGDGVGIKGDVNLYSYMDDTHIDSALRNLVKPLDQNQ